MKPHPPQLHWKGLNQDEANNYETHEMDPVWLNRQYSVNAIFILPESEEHNSSNVGLIQNQHESSKSSLKGCRLFKVTLRHCCLMTCIFFI